MDRDLTRPVYIIGHKNPDRDCICSAIAYTYLKNQVEGGGYIAARAGQLNQETQYVLNFFQVEAPVYVADVMTQVKDIEIREDGGCYGKPLFKAGVEPYAPSWGGDASDHERK